MDAPGFPRTDLDAGLLLKRARSRSTEAGRRHDTAIAAADGCMIQLRLLEQASPGKDTSQLRADHLRFQEECVTSRTEMVQAERDIGFVRSLLRRRGFPLDSGGDPPTFPVTTIAHSDGEDCTNSDSNDGGDSEET